MTIAKLLEEIKQILNPTHMENQIVSITTVFTDGSIVTTSGPFTAVTAPEVPAVTELHVKDGESFVVVVDPAA